MSRNTCLIISLVLYALVTALACDDGRTDDDDQAGDSDSDSDTDTQEEFCEEVFDDCLSDFQICLSVSEIEPCLDALCDCIIEDDCEDYTTLTCD